MRQRPVRRCRGVDHRGEHLQQLTFLRRGELRWEDVAEPVLSGEGDAIVRPAAVATCDLDAALMAGRAPLPGPFAFGHEFVAEVVEIGDGVSTVDIGDRVIVPFQLSCGACERCRRGLTGSCETVGAGAAYGMAPIARREWGGALSDLVLVPFAGAMLVALPATVDPATVASVSDNVPDGWRAVAPPLDAAPRAPVLVVGGAGDVALYAVAVAVALDSERVDYVDTDHRRLRVAETIGANAIEQPVDGSRARLLPGHGRPQRRDRRAAQRDPVDRARGDVHLDGDLLHAGYTSAAARHVHARHHVSDEQSQRPRRDPRRARPHFDRQAPTRGRDERGGPVGRRRLRTRRPLGQDGRRPHDAELTP
jgi:D-arabinose 1-dehydrogenase-like Zn-dependent alcohol dehydrogenase